MISSLTPRVPIVVGLVQDPTVAFLSSQVVQMMLGVGPCFENIALNKWSKLDSSPGREMPIAGPFSLVC